MKGLQIFLHSLRQVTGNLASAVQVSLVPYAVQFIASLALLGTAATTGQSDPAEMTSADGGAFFVKAMLNLVAVLITSIWAAVAWHRFVLRGEAAGRFIPSFNADRNWAYFVRSFGIGLLCVVLAIPLGMVGGLVSLPFMDEAGPSALSLGIMFFVTYFPIAVISYRLSTALPATALDAPTAFSAGWDATKGQLSTFVVLALISTALFFAVSEIGARLFGSITALALVWQFAFGWLSMMIGLSILTTLYGHYIEKRALA